MNDLVSIFKELNNFKTYFDLITIGIQFQK